MFYLILNTFFLIKKTNKEGILFKVGYWESFQTGDLIYTLNRCISEDGVAPAGGGFWSSLGF